MKNSFRALSHIFSHYSVNLCAINLFYPPRFQVLRANATTPEQLRTLSELYEEDTRIDFWTRPSAQRGTDIMVPLDHLDDLKEYLVAQNIPFTVMIGDVQR